MMMMIEAGNARQELVEPCRAGHQGPYHRPRPALPDQLYGPLKGRAVVDAWGGHGG